MLKTIVLFALITLYHTTGNYLNAQTFPNTPWPEWVFHHWVWEDESTQQSATQLVDDYLANDIPVGAIIIDSPWETGYNTFEWDPALYPNPQAMIDSFHAKNVRVLMWITTTINTDVDSLYNYADSMGYFMKENAAGGSKVINWWKGDGSLIDFFNPDAVDWWKTLMDKTLDMGIDGWKCDGTDYSVLLGNATYSPGAGRNVTRLEYSHAYYRLFHDYTRQKSGNDRVNMTRPVDNYGLTFITDPNLISFTPVDIGWACWVGDQDATFDGLKNALNNMYHSGENGYLIFGSDIGGYRNEPVPNGRTKELFIRWAQLGAFSPLMENGGSGEHRPWMFDQQTTDIYRTFTQLHYALIPYFMVQSDSLFAEGESMMQFFNTTTYSYMLGSDIFAAPVLSASSNITIDFPAGDTSWVYLFDDTKIYQPGTSASLTVPLEEYPVFIKASSPLLATLDSVLPVTTGIEAFNNPIEFTVYPNPANETLRVVCAVPGECEGYELRLYDVLGHNVIREKLEDFTIAVDIRKLDNGIYFYSILKEQDSRSPGMTGKVIIQ